MSSLLTDCPVCSTPAPGESPGRDDWITCPRCQTRYNPMRIAAALFAPFSKPLHPLVADGEDPLETELGTDTTREIAGRSPGGGRAPVVPPHVTPTQFLGAVEKDSVEGIRLGPYTLVRRIGCGGFSVVFEAIDGAADGRRVALKVLETSYLTSREHQERFKREAFLTAQLHHPNIVKIHAIGRDGERWYLAMELVEGRSLGDRIDAAGPIPRQQAIELTLHVLKGLAAAHRVGVIHRDIKPDNILLASDGRVKLVDFGLARADFASSLTKSGTIFGTPCYMAPEQFSDEDLDTRVDIHALGATLYHMLSGRMPHEGEHPLRIMHRHHRGETFDPGAACEDLPKPLCRVIRKMMANRRSDRYDSLEAVEADLRRCLEGKEPAAAAMQV